MPPIFLWHGRDCPTNEQEGPLRIRDERELREARSKQPKRLSHPQRIILDTTMKSSLSFLIAALVVSFMGAVGAAAQGGRLCEEARAAWQTFGDGYHE